MGYAAIGAAVVIGVLLIAVKVQTSRLDAVKSEYATFKAEVKVLGEAAIKAAKERESADNERKKNADAQNAKSRRDLDDLYSAYRSLRDQRGASGSLLPPTPSGSASPATATFDREALNRGLEIADGVLQEGALRSLQRGDQAITDLNTSKRWAQSIK